MIERTVFECESDVLICEIKDILEELKKRLNKLSGEQSKVDFEKSDIEHYIEFGNFSASEGYKATMILKECLERWRAIKDEFAMVKSMADMLGNKINPERIEGIIKKPDNRKYNPRVRKELFEVKKPVGTEG